MPEQRVLFQYNGHGVPKPTANRNIWVFINSYTQYIHGNLDSWMKTPSVYVFDCSAAVLILNAFVEVNFFILFLFQPFLHVL